MRGTLTAFKSNAILPGFSESDAYWPAVWEAVQYAMPDAAQERPNMAAIAEFLESSDAKVIAKKQQAAATAEAASGAAAEAARKSAYAQTDEAKRIAAVAEIHRCRATIAQARRAIAQDERIAQVSGYVNVVVREQAGVATVSCEDQITAQWAIYKAHGGAAASPVALQ
jgi:hypothetical protein